MSEPFIAEIRIVAMNFAPRGWANCDGQLLPISGNTALFSLIGTTYGGDGRTTTALPDLRDRVPIGPGRGPGLTIRRLGEKSGTYNVTLSESQMPSHHHFLRGTADYALLYEAQNKYLGQTAPTNTVYKLPVEYTNTPLSNSILNYTGGSQSHENLQPALGLRFCIALQGLYPSRS